MLSPKCCCIICREEKASKGIHSHYHLSHTEEGKRQHRENLIKNIPKISNTLKQFYQEKQLERKEQYYKNPKICKQCGKIIPFEGHQDKIRFCSQSCAATYNNLRKPLKGIISEFELEYNNITIDEKIKYKKDCAFKFNPFLYENIPGYELLLEFGLYHSINNPNGVCRDHMVSMEYGWRYNIDSEIISSPYNCQFLQSKDNIAKGSGCNITIEELLLRIQNENFILVESNSTPKRLPVPEEGKAKMSAKNKLYHAITNGIENKRILKTEEIPEGFKIGQTKKRNSIEQEKDL